MRSRLIHQAFVYSSAEELVGVTAPFLREGLADGDSLLVATARANLAPLREALGADADRVEMHDTEEWHPRPADRLNAVRRLVEGLEPGVGLRLLGEPVWTGSEAVLREWARYESVINVALAAAPLRFVCLYDRSRLGPGVLSHACCTHPELVGPDGEARPSDDFVAPDAFLRRLALGSDAAPGTEVHDVVFDGDHHTFRAALADRARAGGLDGARSDEFVIAANEVSSNAVVHGEPPVRARTWTADRELVCEISDAGPGLDDPFAGWSTADRPEPGGWGLALSRRLCDALEIVPDDHGTRVYLHMSLDGAAAADSEAG